MTRKKTILLIEDDYLDVKSVKRTLDKLKVDHELHVAHNGVDALALLNGNSPGGLKLLPDVILLDLNMPKMSGIEFLGIIKNYYSLKNIKIFVMTTSAEEYDVVTTQNLGVSGYILKPLDFDATGKDNFAKAVQDLKSELCDDGVQQFMPLSMAPGVKKAAAPKIKSAIFKKLLTFSAKPMAVVKLTLGGLALTSGAGAVFYGMNRHEAPKAPHSTSKELPVKMAATMPIVPLETVTAIVPPLESIKPRRAGQPRASVVSVVAPAQPVVAPLHPLKAYKVRAVMLDDDDGPQNDSTSNRY